MQVRYRDPERTYRVVELVRNRITLSGRRFSRLHSKLQRYEMYASVWSLQSDRLPLSAPRQRKNVCSSTKMPSASGGFVPWPTTGGSAPWTPAGGCAPDPRYSLALPRSPYQTSLLLSQLQTACDAAVCEPVCSANSPWTHQDAAASGEGLGRRVWTEQSGNHVLDGCRTVELLAPPSECD